MNNIFQPFHNPPKSKERNYGKGKYLYDVFYEINGEPLTGIIRGDNQNHARQNFDVIYCGEVHKIKHFQRYPVGR